MKITASTLRRIRACPNQVAAFDREWPEGAEVTLENALHAAELGLDLTWFVRMCFTSRAQAAYERACEAASIALYAAADLAYSAYGWAMTRYYSATYAVPAERWLPDSAAAVAARRAFGEAKAAAQAAYRKACAIALFETFELKEGVV